MTVRFIVLPFSIAKRGGKLVAGQRQEAKTAEKAISAAERMAGQVAGVVVLEEHFDATQDIYKEPRLLRQIGEVPPEMIEALAA